MSNPNFNNMFQQQQNMQYSNNDFPTLGGAPQGNNQQQIGGYPQQNQYNQGFQQP